MIALRDRSSGARARRPAPPWHFPACIATRPPPTSDRAALPESTIARPAAARIASARCCRLRRLHPRRPPPYLASTATSWSAVRAAPYSRAGSPTPTGPDPNEPDIAGRIKPRALAGPAGEAHLDAVADPLRQRVEIGVSIESARPACSTVGTWSWRRATARSRSSEPPPCPGRRCAVEACMRFWLHVAESPESPSSRRHVVIARSFERRQTPELRSASRRAATPRSCDRLAERLVNGLKWNANGNGMDPRSRKCHQDFHRLDVQKGLHQQVDRGQHLGIRRIGLLDHFEILQLAVAIDAGLPDWFPAAQGRGPRSEGEVVITCAPTCRRRRPRSSDAIVELSFFAVWLRNPVPDRASRHRVGHCPAGSRHCRSCPAPWRRTHRAQPPRRRRLVGIDRGVETDPARQPLTPPAAASTNKPLPPASSALCWHQVAEALRSRSLAKRSTSPVYSGTIVSRTEQRPERAAIERLRAAARGNAVAPPKPP